MRVIITRHGESTANTLRVFSSCNSGYPLTENGSVQALELATKLEGIAFARIYSSPILRAIETAHIVCEYLGRDFVIADAIKEFSVGEFEGRGDKQAWDDFSILWSDWYLRGLLEKKLPGGESLLECRQRAISFLQGLTLKYSTNDQILCVSHGGLINAVIPELAGRPPYEYVWNHSLKNTGVVILDWDGTRWECLQWGDESFTGSK